MADIVERLRDKECRCVEWKHCAMCQAADEIERLRAIITRQTAAQQSNKQ